MLDKTNFALSPATPQVNEFLKPYCLLNAKTVAATITGAAVLTQYDVSTLYIQGQSGDKSGTLPTLDVVIQESANGTTGWVTIATLPRFTDADQTQYMIVQKTKKYIRHVSTLGGSATPKLNLNLVVLE